MSGALSAIGARSRVPSVDSASGHSTPDLKRFAVVTAELALLLFAFYQYSLESQRFFRLGCLMFGGFAVSYWLPLRFKEYFFIALSLVGAYFLLDPVVATLLIASGGALFAIIRSPVSFRNRTFAILSIAVLLAYGRASGRFPVPDHFWPVFGALYMFRMIIYLYDISYSPGPPLFKDFLSYFFLLPNYYFLLFPVVDFRTFKRSFFQRNINVVAQQGVWWILRGTIQLILYRLVWKLEGFFIPSRIGVSAAVIARIILGFMLYLQVSGQFHIIAGMLNLFGYDVPETNRKYLLSHSINDFWRRINIYWKDFMVKICYLPVYFKLRKKGEFRAQLVATGLVFLVTWVLHAYQFFWLQGKFRLTANDLLFWMILGALVVTSVWVEAHQKRRLPAARKISKPREILQIVTTVSVIMLLWSLWSFDTLTAWIQFLRTGVL